MKRVAIAGMLYNPNLGDQFIAKAVEYIVRDRLPKTEIQLVDFDPQIHNLRYYMTGIVNRCISHMHKSKFVYKIQYLNMKWRLEKYYDKLLKDTDALIFACGSFKYSTQRLWINYSILVDCCEKKKIPVMFDAMNIQEFDSDDWRCKLLRKKLNTECVKCITTRDGEFGVKRLLESYVTNPDLFFVEAFDPALWIPECYGIKKQTTDIVGINIIRPNIFDRYSFKGEVSEDDMIAFYENLIIQLINSDLNFELFSNGLEEDLWLIDRIQKRGNIRENLRQYLKIPQTARELASIVSKYRVVWGARLHACICALSFDIPTVSFAWDDKMVHFGEFAGMEDFMLQPSELNANKAMNRLSLCCKSEFDWERLHRLKMQTSDTIFSFLNQTLN